MRTRADPERLAAWRQGSRDILAVLLGVSAWAVVTGVAMAQSTLTTPQAVAMSLLAFAGSAQLAVLPLFAVHAPLWLIVLTALVVNLRFVIYSVALAKPFGHLPLSRRLWMSYVIGDVPFALYSRQLELRREAGKTEWPQLDAYMSGMMLTNWLGIALGAIVPHQWGLGLAGSLALVALLIPMATKKPAALVGVIVTAFIALLTYHLPMRLGVIIAILVGVVAALMVDTWTARRASRVVQ